jgi:SAM-dependent methyltransferase
MPRRIPFRRAPLFPVYAKTNPLLLLTADQRSACATIKETLDTRTANLGKNAAGLYNYYTGRPILINRELWLIQFLRGLRGTRVWDIGAGIGQLSAMLAVDGIKVVAVDHDGPRAEAMRQIADRLAPLTGDRFTVRFGSFPDVAEGEDVSNDIALVFSCVFAGSAERYRAFLLALSRFRCAIVAFGSLFIPAREVSGRALSEPEWDYLRAQQYCADAGFPAPIPIGDFGYVLGGRPWRLQSWRLHVDRHRWRCRQLRLPPLARGLAHGWAPPIE